MNKFCFVIIFSWFGLTISYSQTQPGLFMPSHIKQAYSDTAMTRQENGEPGSKYWQNKSKYNISVTLDTASNLIVGREKIMYFNSSPKDTLVQIVIKLDMNFYRKGSRRHQNIHPSRINQGITLDLVNEDESFANYEVKGGILEINLKTPLPPKGQRNFTIEWNYPIPYGDNQHDRVYANFLKKSFFIAYWYPRIAVYDDLQGWDKYEYEGGHEFYNDFSDYEVSISVPNSMVVWATGEWQNSNEILEKRYLNKYLNCLESNEIQQIFSEHELLNGKVLKKTQSAYRTFKFKAMNVPDFAWASTNQYNWLASSIEVDKKSKRRTLLNIVYPSSAKDFRSLFPIVKDGMELMSSWMPKVPFPYPTMTIFNGDDRMEFPMMSNQFADELHPFRAPPLTPVTIHEVAHTYFPFLTGINEQKYAWMDEGWASLSDYLLVDTLSRKKNYSIPPAHIREYYKVAGNIDDLPPMIPSYNLAGGALGVSSYIRTQAAFMILRDYLGHDRFVDCFKEFINRWAGKHPTPYDFFNSFNDISGENLNWFWKPWFFEFGIPDLRIDTINTSGKNVVIENIGTLPFPVFLEIIYSDGEKNYSIQKPISVWKGGNKIVDIELNFMKEILEINLISNPEIAIEKYDFPFIDADTSNNNWKKNE